jgi:hypothetical protein
MSTYSPVANQALGSGTASISFTGIPQGYTDLVLVCVAKGASPQSVRMQFNNDTAANYSSTNLYADIGNTPSADSARYTGETSIRVGYVQNGISTTDFLSSIIHLQNYSNTTTYKSILSRSAQAANATVGLWQNTSAITSVTVFPSGANFASGSTFSLYGIAGGQASAKASGGIITTSGAYTIHTFTQSGGFIPNENLTVDYLVVAGGGGGGGGANAGEGGGGGAGGLRSTVTATGGGGSLETALSLTAGVTYPAIVGAGGAGNVSSSFPGSNGTNSTFASISSVGGGGGGSRNTEGYAGQIGGSGGGGGQRDNTNANKGSGTANQGFAGGNGFNDPAAHGGGGGGGAGGAGADCPSTSTGGAGGSSVNVSITGSSVAYAGGGGGAGASTGGASGGAGAGAGNSATAATANSGSGGGGTGGTGGLGGSGIVIVRYLT